MSTIDIVRENFKARTDIQGELRQIDEAATRDQRDYTDDEKGERLFKEEVRSKLADLSKQVAGLIAQAAKKGKE